MQKVLVAVCVALTLAGTALGQSAMEMSLRPQGVESYYGTALIGVDASGRFLIAFDATGDGLVDHCFLYTHQSRLPGGPWSERLTNVTMRHAVGSGWASLTLGDAVGDLYLRLAVNDAPLDMIGDTAYARHIVHDAGWELVRVRPPTGAEGAALDEMSHAIPTSWPESFWYDLLSQASSTQCVEGNDSDCLAGGLDAGQCSFENITPGGACTREGSCSVTCASYPRSFACCGCERFNSGGILPNVGSRPACRCRACDRMLPARPRPGAPPAATP